MMSRWGQELRGLLGVYLLGLGGLSDIHLGTPPFPPLLLTSFCSEQPALVSLALERPTPGFPTDCSLCLESFHLSVWIPA